MSTDPEEVSAEEARQFFERLGRDPKAREVLDEMVELSRRRHAEVSKDFLAVTGPGPAAYIRGERAGRLETLRWAYQLCSRATSVREVGERIDAEIARVEQGR